MWIQWFNLASLLAQAYATSQGKDLRALGYLRLVTGTLSGQQATEARLAELRAEYEAKVAGNIETTAEELAELDQRLADVSAETQSA